MATFPNYASILRDGYAETPDFGVISTETDGPVGKQRPRWSKKVVSRNCSVMVGDSANKVLFDAWFDDDLNGGTAWFTYVDPVDGVSKQARFKGGKLQWQLRGSTWQAQTEIETL